MDAPRSRCGVSGLNLVCRAPYTPAASLHDACMPFHSQLQDFEKHAGGQHQAGWVHGLAGYVRGEGCGRVHRHAPMSCPCPCLVLCVIRAQWMAHWGLCWLLQGSFYGFCGPLPSTSAMCMRPNCSTPLHPPPPPPPSFAIWWGGGARPTEWGSVCGGRPGQRVEEWGTWASRTRKRGGAGRGRPVDGGMWTAKTVKRPPQQPAQPPIRQLLGAADAQTAHPATSSTAPAHQ